MKVNVFSPKQERLLLKLAEGASQRQASREIGMHPVTVCRFMSKPEARQELERLRSESEQRLLQRLPTLIDQALDTLERALDSKNDPDRRLRAAQFTLRLAERLSAQSVVKPNSASATVIDLPVEPPTDPHP